MTSPATLPFSTLPAGVPYDGGSPAGRPAAPASIPAEHAGTAARVDPQQGGDPGATFDDEAGCARVVAACDELAALLDGFRAAREPAFTPVAWSRLTLDEVAALRRLERRRAGPGPATVAAFCPYAHAALRPPPPGAASGDAALGRLAVQTAATARAVLHHVCGWRGKPFSGTVVNPGPDSAATLDALDAALAEVAAEADVWRQRAAARTLMAPGECAGQAAQVP